MAGLCRALVCTSLWWSVRLFVCRLLHGSAAPRETAFEFVVHEAIVVNGGSKFAGRALMKDVEVVDPAVGQIGDDQEAHFAGRLAAEPIDVALEAPLHRA